VVAIGRVMENQTAIGNVRSNRSADPSDVEIASGGGTRFVDRVQRLEDARMAAERATEAARAEQEALGFARGTKAANDLADARAAAAAKALDDARVEAKRIITEATVAAAQRRAAAEESAVRTEGLGESTRREAEQYAARVRAAADEDRAQAAAGIKRVSEITTDLNKRERILKDREAEVGAVERRAHEIIAAHKALAEKYAGAATS